MCCSKRSLFSLLRIYDFGRRKENSIPKKGSPCSLRLKKKKRLASMLAKDAQHVGVHSHPGLSQDVLKDVLSLENPSSNMKESIYEIMTLRRRALLIGLKKRKRLASMLAKNAQNVGVYSA